MADFLTAYKTYILPNEGWYANVAGDKGGETYGGIARNIFPNWKGWAYIDNVKRTSGAIKWNTRFPALDADVQSFYQDWWNGKRFGEFKTQDIANFMFDYNVNSGTTAVKALQKLLNIPQDGAIGNQTIAAVNAADQAKLYQALKDQRKAFLTQLATKPEQAQFLKGWLARVNNFPDLITTKNVSIVGIIVVVGIIGYFLMASGGKPVNA